MATIETGMQAPNLSLFTTTGDSFSLQDALKSATPVVAAFFKVSCPTCQYTFPFLERIYKAYSKDKVRIIGVSQDNKKDTEAFAREYGVSFPILLDDTKKYPSSNAYGLTHVPSLFLISPTGNVEQITVGWLKPEIEQLNKGVAKAAGVAPAQIFKPGEQVADYKAG